MPPHVCPLVGVSSLIKSLGLPEVAVQTPCGIPAESVAPAETSGNLVAERALRQVYMAASVEEAIRTAFGTHLRAALRIRTGHHIDGSD